ncbi:MAG TPA: TIGR04086 family membrane protein [Acidimicrobiales bacterium]|nr:TIGR04086 family membrane protein [Acidimicrobiales bacterium]
MRNIQRVETRRDRRALARDAGLGRISALSVLAGALCGLAAFEILAAAGGALVVASHGSTIFGTWSGARVKIVTAVVAGVALVLSFLFGGYISGRMSRRRGASHGLLAGVVAVILAVALGVVAQVTGADNGLARVARHMKVADTWHQWRSFGLVGAVVAAAIMVICAVAGGVSGERWHGKLLARAVDPAFGPEARERDEARRHLNEAEAARLAGARHVGRQTAVTRTATSPAAATTEAEAPAPAEPAAARDETTVRGDEAELGRTGEGAPPTVESPVAEPDTTDTGGHRVRHLLHR